MFPAMRARIGSLVRVQQLPASRVSAAFMSSRRREIPKPPEPPRLEERFGIRREVNPTAYRLADLDMPGWKRQNKTWSVKPGKFPWKYDLAEMCYISEGRARVYPDNANGEYVEFKAGDVLMFPKGMSCTWDVLEDLSKYYILVDSIEHHYGTSMEGKTPPMPPGRKSIKEILGQE